MPQLTPYFFVEQLLFIFLGLFVLILLFSKIILPVFTSLQVIRTYITVIFKGL